MTNHPPEFMNALGTEYFVLQSTASSTISESGSQVSIYLSSLASGLVAHGFSSSSAYDRFQVTSLAGRYFAGRDNSATWEAGLVLSDLRGLFNDLIRFEIDLWNAVDARLKSEFGLPLTHFEPMAVIDRIDGCRVYDIANELGITTGGTSKLVDRIEASGYCRRVPNPDDRRSSLLELTEEGRRLFAKAGTAFDEELHRRVGAALPERTLRQFASTLTRLRNASRRLEMEEST
jgi:MarR family transcriptional regulator, organic hydroperoxide resistance regulator